MPYNTDLKKTFKAMNKHKNKRDDFMKDFLWYYKKK